MKPLKGNSKYNFILGDSLSVLKNMDDESVNCIITSPPYWRALKNYRYFHFIGVVRRHYRAFTRRSGYDVW